MVRLNGSFVLRDQSESLRKVDARSIGLFLLLTRAGNFCFDAQRLAITDAMVSDVSKGRSRLIVYQTCCYLIRVWRARGLAVARVERRSNWT